MKTTIRFSLIALNAALVVIHLLPIGAQAQTAATAASVTNSTGATGTTGSRLDKLLQSLNNFNRLDEIAQLTKAGVGDPVILTYIKNSETAYNVNAQDIIKLRDQGVSSEVTAALIQRGSEVRQAAQEAAKMSQAIAVTAAPTQQTPPVARVPVPAPVTYVTTPDPQPVSTVSVTYFGSPSYRSAPVCYPQYVTFGSGFCVTPRITFGGGGYPFGGYRSYARFCR